MTVTREFLRKARRGLEDAPVVLRDLAEPLLAEAEGRLDDRQRVARFVEIWRDHGPPMSRLSVPLQIALVELFDEFGGKADP